MTLPRLYELQEYWLKFPPLSHAFAGFIGYKPPETAVTGESDSGGNLSELIAVFQQSGGKMG